MYHTICAIGNRIASGDLGSDVTIEDCVVGMMHISLEEVLNSKWEDCASLQASRMVSNIEI